MCDYSLHAIHNRLGMEGERLVVHRFSTGTIGLAPAPPDSEGPQPPPKPSFWRMLFGLDPTGAAPACAVCIPPGASLILHDIPEGLRRQLGVDETEDVTFTQLTAREFSYRDAVRFHNGVALLLQQLEPGQRIDVLSLASTEPISPEVSVESLVV